jgi:hypothetical protein
MSDREEPAGLTAIRRSAYVIAERLVKHRRSPYEPRVLLFELGFE